MAGSEDTGNRLASVCVENDNGLEWAWLDLPVSDAELESFLHDRLRIDAQPGDAGYHVSDFDHTGLLKMLGVADVTGESVADLNLLCQVFQSQIQSRGESIQEAVGAYIYADDIESPSAIEMANYAMQPEGIPYHEYGIDPEQARQCDSPEEKYGLEVLAAAGLSSALDSQLGSFGLTLGGYVDVERLGRDCSMNDNVEVFDSGYYLKDDKPDVDPNRYSRAELREIISEPQTAVNPADPLNLSDTADSAAAVR